MRKQEMRRLEKKGFERKAHEKSLQVPAPLFEGKLGRMPLPMRMNGYLIDFKDEIIGGFKVDVMDKDNNYVAAGVKIRRWSVTDINDSHTGNRIELSLSLLSPHSLKVTVLERQNF